MMISSQEKQHHLPCVVFKLLQIYQLVGQNCRNFGWCRKSCLTKILSDEICPTTCVFIEKNKKSFYCVLSKAWIDFPSHFRNAVTAGSSVKCPHVCEVPSCLQSAWLSVMCPMLKMTAGAGWKHVTVASKTVHRYEDRRQDISSNCSTTKCYHLICDQKRCVFSQEREEKHFCTNVSVLITWFLSRGSYV